MEKEYREHNGVKYTIQQGKRGLDVMIYHKLADDYIFETGSIKLVGEVENYITHLVNEGFIQPS